MVSMHENLPGRKINEKLQKKHIDNIHDYINVEMAKDISAVKNFKLMVIEKFFQALHFVNFRILLLSRCFWF